MLGRNNKDMLIMGPTSTKEVEDFIKSFYLNEALGPNTVPRAGKIGFSDTKKSVLIKASSGECCTPYNFVLLVTLVGTHIHLIMHHVVYQMK